MSNLKGNIPIISGLLYKIPVSVYHHGRDRWFTDKATIKKKDNVLCFEFARTGNTLPIYSRRGNKLFALTENGIDYQPMEMSINEAMIQLPEYDMDAWRDIEMRRKEERYKPKGNSTSEAMRTVGIGIAIFLIIIAVSYFLNNTHVATSSVSCNINGIDLNYCQQVIANKTAGVGII